MLKKNLLLAFRNLYKNRAFSFINALGLSTGFTAFILIMLYVHFEISFDDFHEDAGNIYRVVTKVTMQNEIINHESNTYHGIISALREDFPGIATVTVISPFSSDETFLRFKESQNNTIPLTSFKGLYADESFFRVLSFPLLTGDAKSVLRNQYSCVISKALSQHYFNNDAVGRILEFTDGNGPEKLLTITGVMQDVPFNSHIKFDVVINLPEEEGNFWDWRGHAYLKFKNSVNPLITERRLDVLAIEKNDLKIDEGDYGQVSTFKLQALRDIHLVSDLDFEFERPGNRRLVYSLMILAILTLAIAWVNYINLSTAMASQKVRQIGIRKIAGASKRALTWQVLTESGLFNLIAMVIAIYLSWLLLPAFTNLVGIPQDAINLSDQRLWSVALLFLFVSAIASGGYPAFVIASIHPLKMMKGNTEGGKGLTSRKVLVVFQFTIATMLVLISTIAYRQLRFMESRELGVNIDEVLVIKALNFNMERWSDSTGGYVLDPGYRHKTMLFTHELRNRRSIVNATSASHLPGQVPVWGTEFKAEGIDPSKAFSLRAIGIDHDFIPTLGIKLLAGRNFSRAFPSDQGTEKKRAVIINETASKLLGFKTPLAAISQHISTYWGADYEIVGVVNSFHQVSLKEDLIPLYFILQPRALSYFAIHFRTHNLSQTVSEIESVWMHHFPDYPFNYFFLDEYFSNQYQSEQRFTKAIGIFTLLAILIGCLGLFGLTSYSIVHRSKEIGIRKVLGASVSNVIGLFSADFNKLILISNCLAIPLVYCVITTWLDNYAYKISLASWLFVVPVIAIQVIAMLVVSLQTMKVATKNPIDSLKYE